MCDYINRQQLGEYRRKLKARIETLQLRGDTEALLPLANEAYLFDKWLWSHKRNCEQCAMSAEPAIA